MTINGVAEHKWYSFNIWAVLAGAVVDIVSSNIVTGCYALAVMTIGMPPMIAQGLTTQKATSELLGPLYTSPITIGLGLLCSILGGYVAGRIAKYHEVKHALASYGAIILISLLLSMFVTGPKIERTFTTQVVLFVLQLAAGPLGGYLAQMRREDAVPTNGLKSNEPT